jgi:2-oxoglutarate ferredoxin oxidoreductase subunit alpha
MLIRALPLTSEVRDFLAEHDTVYLVEQNRDAQMAAIIKDEHPEFGTKIVSVLIYNGLPATPLEVVNQIFAASQAAKTA